MIRLNVFALGMDREWIAFCRERIRRLRIHWVLRTMHRTSLWEGGVRIAGLALLFTLFSVLPGRADLAPKWSDAELLAFSDVVVTGTVAAVSTGWDARTVYTYVTLDVGDVIKGWVPERQIILKRLGGRVDDLALIVGGQAAFTVGERVLVFLEARRGDRTLATTALWQGKWTISPHSGSSQRLPTPPLPPTPHPPTLPLPHPLPPP